MNDLGDASENAAVKQDAAAASTSFFQDVLGGLNGVMATSIPLFNGMSAPLVALPLLAIPAAAAVVALADALGTVIAIAAAFVAPMSVVIGLLGALGLGFAVAAKKAFGMHEDGFGKAISGLKKQFDDLTTTLVGRFMPVFQFLIHNASQALDFLNRIAKLPLDQAFRQLAQQGIPAVKKFFDQIAGYAAKPIRLAFQIAFGQGKAGGEASSAVAQMWNQFTDFLFGYTKTHPIRLASGQVIQLDRRHVDGIFQPLIDWFNRHHFTKEGTKIGHEILNGLKPLAGPLGQFLVHIFTDGMKTAVKGMLNAVNPFSEGTKQRVRALNDWITRELVSGAQSTWNHIKSVGASAWTRIQSVAVGVWNHIRSAANGAISSIANHFSSIRGAISGVIGIANRFWGILQQIAGFFARVFTFHVDWPSPPGWLNSIIGGAGSIVGAIPHAAGSVASVGRTGMGGAHVALGGNVAVIHIHGADLSDAAQRRRVGAQLGDSLMRRWAQQAGR